MSSVGGAHAIGAELDRAVPPASVSTSRHLRHAALAAGLVMLAILPVPWATGLANGSYLAVLALALPLWWYVIARHDAADRWVLVQLATIALACRVAAHVALYGWARAHGGPYLGPDSTVYFLVSRDLASRDFATPVPFAAYFGSYDCAHYYLFAAAQRFLGADLFGLQTLNVALTALIGPLFYSIWRTLRLRHALPLGVGLAVYPSLVALSVNDLLKDPSVLAATVLGAWALVRITRVPSASGIAGLAVVATLALVYVRMSRFYIAAFLEAGVVASLGIGWLMAARAGGRPIRTRGPAAAGVLSAVLLVELVPAMAGWPLTPALMISAVSHSMATPLMHTYAGGLADRVASSGPAAAEPGDRPVPLPEQAALPQAGSEAGAILRLPPVPPATVRAAAEPAPSLPVSSAVPAFLRLPVNAVRKLLGPFPWVPPPSWDPKTILLNDYLLYPGVVAWYAILPMALLGVASTLWKPWRGGGLPLPLLALGLFITLLLVQYLALNLSYRHREFMVPFLAATAAAWLHAGPPPRAFRHVYRAYWALLAAMAAGHLALQAAMR
jgi:hypothetical protein